MNYSFPPLPAPPLLAQVQTPTGLTWYVPHARQHGPFLVQRRYRRTGPAFYSTAGPVEPLYGGRKQLDPMLTPYLNPGAVQAAGLDMSSIMAWSFQNPGQIFTHPTYASLCLRWGDNAHAYHVSVLAQESELDAKSILFTPYTCWLTGQTYYRVATENLPATVFSALATQAGLLPHERQLGLEGGWSGWYLLDKQRATETLAAHGLQLAIACPHLVYGAWIYPWGAGEARWLTITAEAEEACAYYQRLPEESNKTKLSVTAVWGYTVNSPGLPPVWCPLGEKQVPFDYSEDMLFNRVLPYPLSALVGRLLSDSEVAPLEVPLLKRFPTLRERLSTAAYPRLQLLDKLGWDFAKLERLEQYPWELTLAEVLRLAELLEVGEQELTNGLQHELNAWQAYRDQEWEQERQQREKVGLSTR